MNDFNERKALSEENRIEIDKALRYMWIFWIGIIGFPIALIILCQVSGDRFRENIPLRSSSSPIQTIRIIFIIIGVFQLVLSYGLRKYFFSARFKGYDTKRWKPNKKNREPEYIISYKQRNFLPMAIPSSISVYGFMLFMTGDSLGVFYAFIIASLLGSLYQRPRKKEAIEFCAHFLQNQEPEKAEQ
ncbi:MAG: hypothetical protein JW837_17180 [Sedimentisphaerales bacterium]|nr:hypothetical protein [Sedimentisphaerales bacterium]